MSLTTFGEKVRHFFKNNLGYIVVIITSLAYIATGLVNIEPSEESIWTIIADGAMSFLVGMTINRFFNLQGLLKGENDERYINTVRQHGLAVENITPYIDSLDDWCTKQNDKALQLQRNKILINAGMRYDEYFEKDGVAKEFVLPKPGKKESKEKRREWKAKYRAYQKAVKLKLTLLTGSSLTSEGVHGDDPNNLGKTKEEFRRDTFVLELVLKLATALFFGYYAFKLIENPNWGLLIETAVQVSIYLLMGVLTMFTSFTFMIDDYRHRIIRKIDKLQMFYNSVKVSSAVATPANDVVEVSNKVEVQTDGINRQ